MTWCAVTARLPGCALCVVAACAPLEAESRASDGSLTGVQNPQADLTSTAGCVLKAAQCFAPSIFCFDAVLLQYKSQLERLRAKVVEDMEVVKRRDHLEFVEVDPATLKAKPLL